MTQLTTPIAGVNTAIASNKAPFTDMPLGSRVEGVDGEVFVKCVADGSVAIAQYDAVLIDASWVGTPVTTTNATSAFGQYVGVAMTDVPLDATDSTHFWAQIAGTGKVSALANAAANTTLNTTATAGALDDDAGMGSVNIAGIVLSTACGGTAAPTACIITNPTVADVN